MVCSNDDINKSVPEDTAHEDALCFGLIEQLGIVNSETKQDLLKTVLFNDGYETYIKEAEQRLRKLSTCALNLAAKGKNKVQNENNGEI